MGAKLVGVVDVDEMGFDIVGNGLVVFWFPESSLTSGAIKEVFKNKRKLHQLNVKNYTHLII